MNLMPHIRLSKEQVTPFAILPGAPERIDTIATYLENVKPLGQNREFKSIRGSYCGIDVIAVSTGIGGPSTAIVVEELAKLGVKYMIRIGSCGAMKDILSTGDMVLINGAVRDDGTSKSYIGEQYPAIPDYELLSACVESAKQSKVPYHVGMVRSHDMIYNDQKEAVYQYWGQNNVYASDMETAALFVVGEIRGVKCASILNVVAEYGRSTEEGINRYVDQNQKAIQGEKNEILVALEALNRVSR